MAGRPPKVDHVRDSLIGEIASARALVSAIDALPRKVRPSAVAGIHPKYVRQVVELAFMGMVASWEEFVEGTLVRYLAGARTNANYSPSHKHGSASDMAHAYELLSQDANYNSQKDYLKVSDPRWVWRSADFFFSQHPYGCLNGKAELLKHANSIRNRVAHSSDKCRASFKQTAVYFLHPQNNQLTQGYGPGALLLSPVQRHFDATTIQAEESHFNAYAEMYESLARVIVP